MEQKHISWGSVYDGLPALSIKYPWLVAQNLEAEKDDTEHQIFYAMHDPTSHYRCQIPELLGKRIRGCFHGWVILSNHRNNVMWSLWNPMTSVTIRLPPLTLEDGDFGSIKQCCLSSPPSNPTSVLMLTRTKTPTIVFCQLDRKRKRLRWKEMTYAKQLRSITGDNGFLHCLTCCDGKVYGCCDQIVIQVDIVAKDKEVVISLNAFGDLPFHFNNGCSAMKPFLKGYCNDLFYIKLGFDVMAKKTIGVVFLFKLDMTSMIWKEMEDLKDAIFFLDLVHDCYVFYRDAMAPELGGYIHILGEGGKVIHSYDVKDKTISLSSLSSCLDQSTHLSLWECRLHGDHGEIKCETRVDEIMVRPVRDDEAYISNTSNEENFRPHLLNLPFDVLKIIMEFCVGVEYLNLRATCKHFQLTAPMIRWSDETSLRRLQPYSLTSPWLITYDRHRGVFAFTDPINGDKYFMTTPQELTGDLRICCSSYGWLLLFNCDGPGKYFFFNPFTKDIHKLPYAPYLDSLCFSTPPTSHGLVIIGFSSSSPSNVFAYVPSRRQSWTSHHIDFGGTTPHSFVFPIIRGKELYAFNQGVLHVLLRNPHQRVFRNDVVVKAPRGRADSSAQQFLVNYYQFFFLVIVDELGESVEVFLHNRSTQEWMNVESLEGLMIYICGTMCVCMEAKRPGMENKIYFPRLHSKSGNIVFYSLETRRYHTFNGRNMEHCLGDLFGTKYHANPHAWIVPSWS